MQSPQEDLRMKPLILSLSLFLVPAASFAKFDDLKKYKAAYPDKAATATCKVCHGESKSVLTDYGKAYLAAGKDFSKIKEK